MTTTRVVKLGTVDYNGSGRKSHPAEIEMELRDTPKGPELSICGSIWLPSRRDIETGGQCIDTLAKFFPGPDFTRLAEIWRRWHLNGMNAGCQHQQEAWSPEERIEVVTYKLTTEAYGKRDHAITTASRAAAAGEVADLDDTDRALILLPKWWEATEPPDADSPLSGCYEVAKREMKAAGWVRPAEHSRGLLGKPCEACGYAYGSAWVCEALPPEIWPELMTISDRLEAAAGANRAA